MRVQPEILQRTQSREKETDDITTLRLAVLVDKGSNASRRQAVRTMIIAHMYKHSNERDDNKDDNRSNSKSNQKTDNTVPRIR